MLPRTVIRILPTVLQLLMILLASTQLEEIQPGGQRLHLAAGPQSHPQTAASIRPYTSHSHEESLNCTLF